MKTFKGNASNKNKRKQTYKLALKRGIKINVRGNVGRVKEKKV